MKEMPVQRLLTLAFGVMAVLVLLVSLLGLSGVRGTNDRLSGYIAGADERETES